MKVLYDCRYFRGDVPCKPHKNEGVHCEGCPRYEPIQQRILIIKLDAAGDVLRTTCILPGLKEKYPYSQITWITQSASVPLLAANPSIDRIYEVSLAVEVLMTEDFDIAINLDAAPLSSRLAELARAKEKRGFGYHPSGYVYPINPEAEPWFLMGLFDDVKKENKRTYQSLMLDICKLNPADDYSIQYSITPEEKKIAEHFGAEHGIKNNDIIIGLNTGAGSRWEKKKWTEQGYLELIRLIESKYPGIKILLYGGPGEIERNTRLITKSGPRVINTGCSNSIREFAALLDLSTIVVTGDTLALHIAIALQKETVVIVGPTSANELDLYGKGIKMSASMPCLCCYKVSCDNKPDCMMNLSPERVFSAIESMLDR